MACHRDPALEEMYALLCSQGLLERRLKALSHHVSKCSTKHTVHLPCACSTRISVDMIRLSNVQLRVSMAYHRDPALGEMYAVVRSQGLLESWPMASSTNLAIVAANSRVL